MVSDRSQDGSVFTQNKDNAQIQSGSNFINLGAKPSQAKTRMAVGKTKQLRQSAHRIVDLTALFRSELPERALVRRPCKDFTWGARA